jgi:hypothetical protein
MACRKWTPIKRHDILSVALVLYGKSKYHIETPTLCEDAGQTIVLF